MLALSPIREAALSAPDLGLPEEAREALCRVHEMFQRREFTFVPGTQEQITFDDTKYAENGFSMTVVFRQHYCDTVGCIKGWAEHLHPLDTLLPWDDPEFSTVDKTHELHLLFMPFNYASGRYTDVDAFHALDTYLKTGKAEWKD